MAEGTSAQAVRALYHAYETGDQATIENMIGEEIDWVIYGPVAVFPFQGARRGKGEVLKVLAEITSLYSVQTYQPEIVIAEGDRAAALSNVSFIQRSTGRVVRIKIANFLRFADGKLVEFREFMDSFDAAEQALGQWISIPPASPH